MQLDLGGEEPLALFQLDLVEAFELEPVFIVGRAVSMHSISVVGRSARTVASCRSDANGEEKRRAEGKSGGDQGGDGRPTDHPV